MNHTSDLAAVADLIGRHRFALLDEAHLQASISDILTGFFVVHGREVRLGDRDRIDFLTASGVGLEVKVAGAPDRVLAQLARYATHEPVRSLLLVTTKATHCALPVTTGGVPLRVLLLRGVG